MRTIAAEPIVSLTVDGDSRWDTRKRGHRTPWPVCRRLSRCVSRVLHVGRQGRLVYSRNATWSTSHLATVFY